MLLNYIQTGIKMTSSLIEIDLSRFINITGKLVPGVPLELKLIEFYSQIESDEDNAFNKFTNYILKYLYKDSIDRPYSEITTFYKEKEYIHIVVYFLDMLEIYILSKIEPNVINIKFKEFKEKTDTKIVGVFELWKP